MKFLKRITLWALLLLVLLAVYVLINTFRTTSKQIKADKIDVVKLSELSKERFSEAIAIKTVSPEDIADFDSIQFDAFNQFLKTSYPLTDSLLGHKVFNNYSHLYKWEGSAAELKPVILMAHLDVVPVIDQNIQYWREDPFAGTITNDTIWGRGTIDDKIGIVGLMESIEYLLEKGYQPERSILFAFGHDEEIGGSLGANTIASYLEEQGIRAEFVMDEGGSLTRGLIPGLDKDVAMIGIAEKGFVTLKLSIKMEGGHSSMPAKETSIDVMADAIAKLKKNPFPATISEPLDALIDYLGPEMPFVNRMAFANKDIFKPLIINAYESTASGNALVRTTTSPTIFNSGVKDNIIPLSANATVNFRVIPGSDIDEVIAHVKKVVDDDRIKIAQASYNIGPSKVSSLTSLGFTKINRTIAQVFPEALVTPHMVVGATDARHFSKISDQIYRFSPITISKDNIKSFHGLNERIALSDLELAITFYGQLIRNISSE